MEPVILFGNGQNAALAHASFSQDPAYRVVAFTVDGEFIQEKQLLGLPVVPFEQVESLYPPDDFRMFLSISFRRVNRLRAEKYAQAKAKGYSLASLVSSKTSAPAGLCYGDNCLIAATHLAPYIEIGNDVVIASGCLIGHHTIVGDHCYLAPGVIVSGSVTIEPYCFIGAGAVIRDRLTVREASVIGAGAVILEDTVERGVYLARQAERLPITSDELPVG